MKSKKYDVAISFAGEDRDEAKRLATALKESGLNVFFDEWASEELWGKNLHEYLTAIYRETSLTLIIISSAYSQKQWTRTELKNLRNSAVHNPDYTILPIKVDDSPYPSELSTIGYIDLRNHSINEIGELIKKKLASITKEGKWEKEHKVKTYHVIPRFNDWAVKRGGASRATATYKSKSEAVEKAKELVRSSSTGKIVIHKSDGTIEKKTPVIKTRGKAK